MLLQQQLLFIGRSTSGKTCLVHCSPYAIEMSIGGVIKQYQWQAGDIETKNPAAV